MASLHNLPPVCDSRFSEPIYPSLEHEEVDGICGLIREPFARVGSKRSEEEPLSRPAEDQASSSVLDPISLE